MNRCRQRPSGLGQFPERDQRSIDRSVNLSGGTLTTEGLRHLLGKPTRHAVRHWLYKRGLMDDVIREGRTLYVPIAALENVIPDLLAECRDEHRRQRGG